MPCQAQIPRRQSVALILLAALSAASIAAPEGPRQGPPERQVAQGERNGPPGERAAPPEGARIPPGAQRTPSERAEREHSRSHGEMGQPRPDRVAPGGSTGPLHGQPPPRPSVPSNHWYDGAHGHSHAYPVPGWNVRSLPRHSHTVVWGGVNYGFYDGVWYSPGPRGYVVVRPPFGIVVRDLPLFRTVVMVGGLNYLYANGVYYREVGDGGYEVVPPPVAADVTAASNAAARTFVYPRMGQSAQQQATDEYECHRWAVSQSGFDPTAAATSTTVTTTTHLAALRDNYQRARIACLEGRNYTVR